MSSLNQNRWRSLGGRGLHLGDCRGRLCRARLRRIDGGLLFRQLGRRRRQQGCRLLRLRRRLGRRIKGLFGRDWLLRRRQLGRCRSGLSLRRPKLRHGSRRLIGRPKLRADGPRRNSGRRVPGSRSPDHFTPETCGEPVFGLQDAAMLLGERVRERGTGGEAALDDDLTKA